MNPGREDYELPDQPLPALGSRAPGSPLEFHHELAGLLTVLLNAEAM